MYGIEQHTINAFLDTRFTAGEDDDASTSIEFHVVANLRLFKRAPKPKTDELPSRESSDKQDKESTR